MKPAERTEAWDFLYVLAEAPTLHTHWLWSCVILSCMLSEHFHTGLAGIWSDFNVIRSEMQMRRSEWTLKPKPSSCVFISVLLLASWNHWTHFTHAPIDISVLVLMVIHAADSPVHLSVTILANKTQQQVNNMRVTYDTLIWHAATHWTSFTYLLIRRIENKWACLLFFSQEVM